MTSIKSVSFLTRNVAAEFKEGRVDTSYSILIPSRFPPISLFSRIANGREHDVAEIESLTNPRLRDKELRLTTAGELTVNSHSLQNWNHAPFAYSNPNGSIFFGSETPILEMAQEIETALAISVGKREWFMNQTCEKPSHLDMRVVTRPVQGRFADFRSFKVDMKKSDRFEIGKIVAEKGLDGIIFCHPARPTGCCIAVIRIETLGRAIQGEHFRYVWDGNQINMLYAFTRGITINRQELSSPNFVLAA